MCICTIQGQRTIYEGEGIDMYVFVTMFYVAQGVLIYAVYPRMTLKS